MTNSEAAAAIDSVLAQLTLVRNGLAPATVPTPNEIRVTAGQNLRTILDTAPSGATVRCEPGTYQGPFVLTKPVTLTSTAASAAGRATADQSVWLTSADETVTVKGPDITLAALGIKSTATQFQLLNVPFGAQRTVIDQVTCLGDPAKGQRRGMRPEGAHVAITRCYIDHIGLPGLETQGIGFSLGGSDILIDDCYICAAAEAVMIGGSDTVSVDRIPTRIVLSKSTLTKRPEWYAAPFGWQIKNALELKSAIDVHVSDCVLQYGGIAEGQGAYLIVLTPRNQDGTAPWSTVRDVIIERCHGSIAGGCVSMMGDDYMHPSGPLKNVLIKDCLFDQIDPRGITKGDGRAFFVTRAPQQIMLENLTVRAVNLTSNVYFGPFEMPPTGMILRNLQMTSATYPLKIDGGGQGAAAVKLWAPDIVLDRVGTADATGATGYPA